MSAPDEFAAIAAALAALPGRDRRAVLKALAPEERARLAVLLEPAQPKSASETDAGEGLERFSPWLVHRLREAQAGPAEGGSAMTPATRRLLLRAANESGASRAQPGRPARSSSLIEAIGALLAPRRWAR